jgi:FAD/FMN-containing dehydrogenase
MFPIAHCPSVPMSGFLLNGGYGFNAGELGPSAMLIEAMEIVTAGGEIVRASSTENKDLFWAARGAGPSFFGIVTQFELRLLPLQQAIYATNLIYPLNATEEVTQALHKVRQDCPRNVELTFLASAGAGPPNAPAIGIVGAIAFANDENTAMRSLRFLDGIHTSTKPIAAQEKAAMRWPDLFEAVASLFPPKMSYLGNTIWSASPVSDLYAPYAKHLAEAPSPHSFSNCVLYPSGFREAVADYDAALSMQGDILSLQYAIWQGPAESARNEAWFRQSTALFQPHAAGHYIGETDLNLYPQFAQNCFSDAHWRRLAALRKQYDPSNLFFDFLGESGDVR